MEKQKKIIFSSSPYTDSKRNHSFFPCSKCNKKFSTKGNLNNHIRTIHENIRPYKCPYENCKKSYATSGRLETHKRTHIGMKPYKCDICGKLFNEKGNLKTHLLFHSSFRPFKCEYCSKSYKTKGHLKEHIQIQHLNIKKYKCQICNCVFGRNNALNIHLRVHEKPKEKEENESNENCTRPSSNINLVSEENKGMTINRNKDNTLFNMNIDEQLLLDNNYIVDDNDPDNYFVLPM